MRAYLDASAAVKLIVEEAESAALAAFLGSREFREGHLVSGWLLHTELWCAARRRADVLLDPEAVSAALDTVTLVDLSQEDFRVADTVGRGLRTLDALHLTVALRLEAEVMFTYDGELQAAARRAGLQVVAPA